MDFRIGNWRNLMTNPLLQRNRNADLNLILASMEMDKQQSKKFSNGNTQD
jgi:hypothetical protein